MNESESVDRTKKHTQSVEIAEPELNNKSHAVGHSVKRGGKSNKEITMGENPKSQGVRRTKEKTEKKSRQSTTIPHMRVGEKKHKDWRQK